MSVSIDEDRPVAALAGELDTAGADEVVGLLASALRRHGGLVVDLAGLRFLDCAGLGALVGLRLEADQAGLPLLLARPPLRVSRLIRLAGGTDLLDVRPRLDRALHEVALARQSA